MLDRQRWARSSSVNLPWLASIFPISPLHVPQFALGDLLFRGFQRGRFLFALVLHQRIVSPVR
jgi:hypothetical protein